MKYTVKRRRAGFGWCGDGGKGGLVKPIDRPTDRLWGSEVLQVRICYLLLLWLLCLTTKWAREFPSLFVVRIAVEIAQQRQTVLAWSVSLFVGCMENTYMRATGRHIVLLCIQRWTRGAGDVLCHVPKIAGKYLYWNKFSRAFTEHPLMRERVVWWGKGGGRCTRRQWEVVVKVIHCLFRHVAIYRRWVL